MASTKRGLELKVVIDDPVAIRWFHAFAAKPGLSKRGPALRLSYTRLNRWLKRLLQALGFSCDATTHTLRRSGATHRLHTGSSVETIMEYGRWASNRSC
eukprot:6741126-Lingulodinium_polyedra.AAC.1